MVEMSTARVAEGESQLSDLIDRALGGEDIVIMRDGRPVAELKATRQPSGRLTPAILDRLAESRRGRGRRSGVDAGTLVSQMRDEDWK